MFELINENTKVHAYNNPKQQMFSKKIALTKKCPKKCPKDNKTQHLIKIFYSLTTNKQYEKSMERFLLLSKHTYLPLFYSFPK